MPDDSSSDLIEALNALERDEVIASVQEQLANNTSPQLILDQLSAGLEKLGDRFASGECFIPELIQGGEIFREALDIARPAMEATGSALKTIGTFLIGTVRGDLHDLGKNLLSITLSTAGFEVIDLGKDVASERFVTEVERLKPDLLGLSALLTTTMEKQREVIEALKVSGLRDDVVVMVGGAPVNQRWADEIGADAYGADAIDGLRKAKGFVKAAD
jgi:corrinoid protein of di/trimethylamine methyltransferase